MLSFDNLGPKLTIQGLLSAINEEEIYRRWSKDFPSSSCHCPWRKDKTASFGFYKDGTRWMWKDMGGDRSFGDVIDFVKRMENLISIPSTLQLIAETFNYSPGYTTNKIIRGHFPQQDENTGKYNKQRALIQAVRREPNASDLAFLQRRLITPQTMKYYMIRVADEVWLKRPEWKEKKCVWVYKENNPIFYWLSPFSNHIKCYRPFESNPKAKWLSNMDDNTDVQGYVQCRIKEAPGRPLLLVKSMMEIGFFRSFGINTMAPNGEGYHVNPDFIRHIKKYCNPIISVYDPDPAGITGMKYLKKNYQIPGLVIPKSMRPYKGMKDPTDIWTKDYKTGYKLLNLIYEYIEHQRSVDAAPYGFHYT